MKITASDFSEEQLNDISKLLYSAATEWFAAHPDYQDEAEQQQAQKAS